MTITITDEEYQELMRVKREYEKLKVVLIEADVLADLVINYDLLDYPPLNDSELEIILSERVSRAWKVLDTIKITVRELLK